MKKIAWVKYTGSLEVGDGLLFTTGTTDLRTELFRALNKAGVELYLYSPLTRESTAFLQTEVGKRDFDKLHVRKDTAVREEVDFLIVESGPDNARFDMGFEGKRIPQISYCNRLLKNYKGLVFYMQIDLALPFTFFPEFLSMEYANNYLDYGNFTSLIQDKTFVVLTPSKKIEEFTLHQQKVARNRYNDLYEYEVVHFDTFEFHYCGIYGLNEFKPKFLTPKRITYVGGERARVQKFKNYYASNAEQMEVDVWGKWSDETKAKLPKVNWKGILGKGLSKNVYNESTASVIIGDLNYEKLDIVSGRFFEVVTAKTIPLIDVALKNTTIADILDENLLNELTVKNGADIAMKVNRLHSSNERLNLIMQCVKSMRKFSPNTSVQLLHDIYLKYKSVRPSDSSVRNMIRVYNNLLAERVGNLTFSKEFYNRVIQGIYEKNSLTEEVYNPKQKKPTIADYSLDFERSFQPVDYCKANKCGTCGDLLGPRKNKSASKEICEPCKEANKDKNIFAVKLQKTRMEENLKNVIIK